MVQNRVLIPTLQSSVLILSAEKDQSYLLITSFNVENYKENMKDVRLAVLFCLDIFKLKD